MCSIIALLVLFLGGVFGFGMTSSMQTAATVEAIPEVAAPQVISCASATSAEADTEALLALVGDTFASNDWTEQITTVTGMITGTWLSSSLGAVAYLEYRQYDCGITPDQLKELYDQAAVQTLFSNYTSYAATATCALDDLQLFEFDSLSNGYDYHVLYWVKQLSPTRAATLMLTFLASNPTEQAAVAASLFPELPTCAPAAA